MVLSIPLRITGNSPGAVAWATLGITKFRVYYFMHLSLKKKKKAVGFDGNKTKSKQKPTDFAQMNVDSTHSLRAWVS